jgi:hypothetical protein
VPTYDLFKHPNKRYWAVKRGFCWPCLFFGSLWFLHVHLWWYALAILGIGFPLILLSGEHLQRSANGERRIALLIARVVLAAIANKLLATSLPKRGYVLAHTLEAENDEHSIELAVKLDRQQRDAATPSAEAS